MIGVELVRYSRKTPASEEAKQVKLLAREIVVLVGIEGIYGSVIRIQPPLTISRDHLDIVVETLEKAIARVERDLGAVR